MAKSEYRNIARDEIHLLKEHVRVLVVTATEVETHCLHAVLEKYPGISGIGRLVAGDQTYYVGVLGKCNVAHVQCKMGIAGPAGSLPTILEALNLWTVKAVAMVGIAFGVDDKKQKIGDILVAEAVVPYDPERIGQKQTLQRGYSHRSSVALFDRFTNQPDWKFPLSSSRYAKIHSGLILSGEALVDNLQARDELLAAYPEAIGGDMEGAGVSAAGHKKNIPWIVAKAICDYGDGQKSKNKKRRQKIAAESSVSLCRHVFDNPDALQMIGIPSNTSVATPGTQQISLEQRSRILFDVYDLSCEGAYLERSSDQIIAQIVASQHVWVSGVSGSGKTNTLIRAGLKAGRPLHFIDLSGAVNSDGRGVWLAIYDALCERFKIKATKIAVQAPLSKIISLSVTAIAAAPKKGGLIVFDELPMCAPATFEQFFTAAAGFVIGAGNAGQNHTTLAFSTLQNPSTLDSFDGKLKSKVRSYILPDWSDLEMHNLFALISSRLSLQLTESEESLLLKKVGNSPRNLKRALNDYITFGDLCGGSIKGVLEKYFV